jgi:hypothetical protein
MYSVDFENGWAPAEIAKSNIDLNWITMQLNKHYLIKLTHPRY